MSFLGIIEIANLKNGQERANTQLRRHIDLCDYFKFKKFPKNCKILDIGCGTDLLAKRLKDNGYNNIDGLDWISAENVEFINYIDNYKQVDLNNITINLNKKYDIIISSDVLEHLESPANFFRFTKNLLEKDGHLIITIPNAFNLFQRFSFLITGNSTRYRIEKMNEFGHISILTINTLKSLLNRVNMNIISVKGGGLFLSRFCIFPKFSFGPLLSYNLLYHIQHKN